MAVDTICPSCAKTLRVKAELVGRHVRCPDCRQKFRIEHVEFGTAEGTVANEALNTIDDRDTNSESSVPTLPNGGTLGRFELQSVLGGGGFGVVYRAVDAHMGREVALKIPRFAPGESKKVRRFLTEARTAARLRHPNIVPVFESGEVDGTPFIAAEFVPGETLANGLKRGRPDVPTAAAWVRQLAEALAYAHDEGIVHRDVKPDNVMLDDRQRPQLMDFGLAKRIDEDSSMTADGSVLGTPSYMSPEQARGEIDQVGPASDQYSLGVVLYELLTGRKPFDGSPHAVIAQVAKDVPPAPRTLDTNIPADIEAICQKAMEKDPSRRYADCGALAADLERWSNGEPIVARPIGPVGRLVRWSRREPVVAGLTVAVLLVSTIGFGAVTVLWGRAQSSLSEATTQRGIAEANALEASERQQEAETALAEVERTKTELSAALAESKTNLAEAEKQRQLAVASAAEAARRQKEAEIAVAEADRQRAAADAQRTAAEESSALAARRQREVRLGLYVKDVNAAQVALRRQDTERCRELLAAHVPRNGEPDLRSLDWYYLLHASTERFPSDTENGGVVYDERPRKKAPPPASLRPDRETLGQGVTALDIVAPATGRTATIYFQRTSNTGRRTLFTWKSSAPWTAWPESATGGVNRQPYVVARTGKLIVVGPGEFESATGFGSVQAPVVVSPDGRFIAGATSSESSPIGALSLITVYDVDGNLLANFSPVQANTGRSETFDGLVSSLAFSPDASQLLVASRPRRNLSALEVRLLAFDGRELTVVPLAGLAELATRERPTGYGREGVRTVFAPDGSGAALYENGAWTLLDLRTGEAHSLDRLTPDWDDPESSSRRKHYGLPLGEFSPDGRTFVFAGGYGSNRRVLGSNRDSFAFRGRRHVVTIVERTGEGPKFVRQIEAHDDLISGLEFAPDGRAFVTSSHDESVRIWDAESGLERLHFDYSAPVSVLDLSDDGTLIATGDDRGTVTVWAAPTELPDSWTVGGTATSGESPPPVDGILEDGPSKLAPGSEEAVGPPARIPRRRSVP